MTKPKAAADGGAFIERPRIDPALVPEPAKPVERTYKVLGIHPVHATEQGSTFTATLPLEQERLLLEGGHIEIVEPAKPQPRRAESKAESG